MTSSFPFFNIAKMYNVPYQEVMQTWQAMVENEVRVPLEHWKINSLYGAIALAELAERKRRAEIESFVPIKDNPFRNTSKCTGI